MTSSSLLTNSILSHVITLHAFGTVLLDKQLLFVLCGVLGPAVSLPAIRVVYIPHVLWPKMCCGCCCVGPCHKERNTTVQELEATTAEGLAMCYIP